MRPLLNSPLPPSPSGAYRQRGIRQRIRAQERCCYPAGDRVEAGSRLYIKLRKPQRPDRFSIHAYRDLDGDGFPVGDAQRLSISLERVVRDGKTVGWDVFFYVNRPDRHYLNASGRWNHVRGTKASSGSSSWYFHVKTL
jgi:hypothetical protein